MPFSALEANQLSEQEVDQVMNPTDHHRNSLRSTATRPTRTSALLTKAGAMAVPLMATLLESTSSISAACGVGQVCCLAAPILSPVGLGAIASVLASVGGCAALRKHQQKPPRDPRNAPSSRPVESEREDDQGGIGP